MKVWVIGADMGYGHQRAAMPLLSIAEEGRIITANNYRGIPDADERRWKGSEKFYNAISRFKGWGIIGEKAFSLFDKFQEIHEFYPHRNESGPNIQLTQLHRWIRGGWGRHLIEMLLRNPLPIVTTYFAVGHIAEYWNYPAPVFVVVTDSDVSRTWAPVNPEESKLCYLASTERSARRLETYGVKSDRIFLTGFPLPEVLIGPRDKYAREALRLRLARLDPQGRYEALASGLIRQYVGKLDKRYSRPKPVEITFAIGGAGGQMEVARRVLGGLSSLVKQKKIKLNLVAGVSSEVAGEFERGIRSAGLEALQGDWIRILRSETKDEYFRMFSDIIMSTDVLWTKPSEISFYAALGLPIVMTPPVGSQEVRNREWLLDLGAGIDQLAPEAAHEWFSDWISSGRLAEAALQGYMKMERHGAANIRKVLERKRI